MLVLQATGVRWVPACSGRPGASMMAHSARQQQAPTLHSLQPPVMPGTCDVQCLQPHTGLSPILSTMLEIKEQCTLPVLAAVPLPSP